MWLKSFGSEWNRVAVCVGGWGILLGADGVNWCVEWLWEVGVVELC